MPTGLHRRVGLHGLALLLALTPAAALADPPSGFDAHVETLRKSIGVPGVSIAIVENGRPTLAKGYGVRQMGRTDAVTPDTIFPMDRPARRSPPPRSRSWSIRARSAGTTG
jgi:CubicO group peptidase (beta-lactamase class C family)